MLGSIYFTVWYWTGLDWTVVTTLQCGQGSYQKPRTELSVLCLLRDCCQIFAGLKTFACVYLRYRKRCGGVGGNSGSGSGRPHILSILDRINISTGFLLIFRFSISSYWRICFYHKMYHNWWFYPILLQVKCSDAFTGLIPVVIFYPTFSRKFDFPSVHHLVDSLHPADEDGCIPLLQCHAKLLENVEHGVPVLLSVSLHNLPDLLHPIRTCYKFNCIE